MTHICAFPGLRACSCVVKRSQWQKKKNENSTRLIMHDLDQCSVFHNKQQHRAFVDGFSYLGSMTNHSRSKEGSEACRVADG